MRLAAILFCVLPLLAQEQVPSKAEKAAPASIAGMVVRADTGEPLKRASLTLANEEADLRYEARTDSEGRFQFTDLSPGRYSLWAGCQGYVEASYGAKSPRRPAPPIVLEKGQDLQNVLIRLQRTAAITGKVLDENGEPVQDARVAVRFYYGRGEKRRLTEWQSAQTNDLGEYRIYGINPGKYYLRVSPPRDDPMTWPVQRSPRRLGDSGDQAEPQTVYPPIFYPSATDVSQASQIELKGGDEFRADFAVTPVAAFKVRGHLLGTASKSPDPVVVLLLPRGGTRGDAPQVGRVAKDGSYEITDVLPGSYRLSVSLTGDIYDPREQTVVKRTLEVTNSDVDNVDLVLSAASKIEIKGRITVEGETPSSFERFNVTLAPSDEDDEDYSIRWNSTKVNADGTFSFPQVAPGKYFVDTRDGGYGARRGYFMKSARYGTRDITESGFTVTEGTQPRLELLVSTSTARIEGVVKNSKELAVPGAQVLAVLSGSGEINRFRSRMAITDTTGSFVLANIRPGEYKLLALEPADYVDYFNVEFINQHEKESVTAQAPAGSTAKVKLKAISIEDRQQDSDE